MTITITIHSIRPHIAGLRKFLNQMGWDADHGSPDELEIEVQAQFDTDAADVMAELAKDINSYHG